MIQVFASYGSKYVSQLFCIISHSDKLKVTPGTNGSLSASNEQQAISETKGEFKTCDNHQETFFTLWTTNLEEHGMYFLIIKII